MNNCPVGLPTGVEKRWRNPVAHMSARLCRTQCMIPQTLSGPILPCGPKLSPLAFGCRSANGRIQVRRPTRRKPTAVQFADEVLTSGLSSFQNTRKQTHNEERWREPPFSYRVPICDPRVIQRSEMTRLLALFDFPLTLLGLNAPPYPYAATSAPGKPWPRGRHAQGTESHGKSCVRSAPCRRRSHSRPLPTSASIPPLVALSNRSSVAPNWR
jgi:hypothetical protein